MRPENLLELVDNERSQFERDYRLPNNQIKKTLCIDILW